MEDTFRWMSWNTKGLFLGFLIFPIRYFKNTTWASFKWQSDSSCSTRWRSTDVTSDVYISPAGDWYSSPHLPSLRNGVFHDASHVRDREIDVLFPEVFLDAAVIMLVQTLLGIICMQHTHSPSVQSETWEFYLFSAFLILLTFLRLEDVVTWCHVLAGDAQLGGISGWIVSIHLQHQNNSDILTHWNTPEQVSKIDSVIHFCTLNGNFDANFGPFPHRTLENKFERRFPDSASLYNNVIGNQIIKSVKKKRKTILRLTS